MRHISHGLGCLVLALGVALFPASLHTQTSTELTSAFDKSEAMISMRDGARLYTEIYVPKEMPEPLPILITRTPYGVHDAQGTLAETYRELVRDGYIFVFQDIRGRYRSEGHFVMLRPVREKSDSLAIDESTDTSDTIDWLLKNIHHHNARVGILGTSYGGWLATMAMLDPHPALKAVAEQASPADMFLGDDFHHNGAFRLSYGFEFATMMETSKENFDLHLDEYDTYDWYLRLGALSNVNKNYLHGKIPTWNDFAAHPNYDEFWKRQSVAPYLTRVTVPTLNVAGWWDQEDFYGPQQIYNVLERHDSQHLNYFVAGPWNHSGWSRGAGRNLGAIDFESDTAQYYRERIQAPWFAYWLKDKGKPLWKEATTFRTGSNRWEEYDSWPPVTNIKRRKLYFRENRVLSFESPRKEAAQAFDSYISDPANPVPYRARPIEATIEEAHARPGWATWLVQDQRFVDHRPDVLSWETEPLQEGVIVTGDLMAHIFASTSGTDSDWFVKLIDVYPADYPAAPAMGGYQLIIADEVFRGRFRNHFDKPEPVVPNQPVGYAIDLHTTDHEFLKGHRIMVQIQSTLFPLIDRNPQRFVPNIFAAKDSDYQKATQRIYRSGRYASNLELPVLEYRTPNPSPAPSGKISPSRKLRGETAPIANSEGTPILPEAVRKHVVELADDSYEGRGAGYPGADRAAEYIAKQFREIGLLPYGDTTEDQRSFFQGFRFNPQEPPKAWDVFASRNVIGFLEGTDQTLKQQVVVLGAHYDGQGQFGQANPDRIVPTESDLKHDIWNSADDNASGVAAMIEVARSMARNRPRRSVLFIAFSAEEHALNGSVAYVSTPVLPWGRHVAMVDLEKLGRVPNQSLITLASSTSKSWEQVTARANDETGMKAESAMPKINSDSDDYPFAVRGLPSIAIATNHEEDTHLPTDTADKISYDALAQRATYILRFMEILADLNERPRFSGHIGRDLGLVVVLPSEEEKKSARASESSGALKVSSLIPGLPASRAHLNPGDLIVKVNGVALTSKKQQNAVQKAADIATGESIEVKVVRNGQILRRTLKFGKRPN